MGIHASRPSDAGDEEGEAPHYRKGRKASKTISRITLFVVVGNSALFEVKRTQHALAVDPTTDTETTDNTTPKKSDIQISIRQLPVAGHPVAEGAMTTEDLASIKLQKVRRNSIHSFSLNFDRERACSQSLEFPPRLQLGDAMETELVPHVVVGLDVDPVDDGGSIRVHFEYEAEAVRRLSSHKDSYEEDAESDCSESSAFALQISKLVASAIESENETVEKWGEKLAKAIESQIGQPTSVVIKKSSRSRSKKKVAAKTKRETKNASPTHTDPPETEAAAETE